MTSQVDIGRSKLFLFGTCFKLTPTSFDVNASRVVAFFTSLTLVPACCFCERLGSISIEEKSNYIDGIQGPWTFLMTSLA